MTGGGNRSARKTARRMNSGPAENHLKRRPRTEAMRITGLTATARSTPARDWPVGRAAKARQPLQLMPVLAPKLSPRLTCRKLIMVDARDLLFSVPRELAS